MNNSNLYDKLKSREKNLSLNKVEAKATVPQFAKLTTDKMLQCTICNEIMKNEIYWLKHSKSEKHIIGLKLLKESLTKKEKVITMPQKTQTEEFVKIDHKEIEQENHNAISFEANSNIISPANNDTKIHKPSESMKSKVLKFLKDSDKEIESSSYVPDGFFDKPEVTIKVVAKKSKIEENKNKPLTIEGSGLSRKENEKTLIEQQIYENEADNNFDREIETMIECTEFVGNLMNRDKKRNSALEKKFQHVLQADEMLTDRIHIDDKLLNKKRKKINLELEGDDDNKQGDIDNIFESNWRY